MNFLIVTGLSGAGKSMAVNALEDIGFFCIDNIPAGLLPRILDFALQGENQLSRVAVVMDIRGLHSVQETNEALEALDEKKMPYDILFLDASDAAIRRRYKETRRVHPMTISEGIPVSEAITKERQILQPLRERAKYVIDTSLLSTAQNRERVCKKVSVPCLSTWFPLVSNTVFRRKRTSCLMCAACPTRSMCQS